jgi:hypothetical protein
MRRRGSEERFMVKLAISLAFLVLGGIEGPPRVYAQAQQIQLFGPFGEPDPVPPPPGVDPEDGSDEPPPRPARVCRKMCANDFSPCDPIYFKTEDGRCDGIDVGR